MKGRAKQANHGNQTMFPGKSDLSVRNNAKGLGEAGVVVLQNHIEGCFIMISEHPILTIAQAAERGWSPTTQTRGQTGA